LTHTYFLKRSAKIILRLQFAIDSLKRRLCCELKGRYLFIFDSFEQTKNAFPAG